MQNEVFNFILSIWLLENKDFDSLIFSYFSLCLLLCHSFHIINMCSAFNKVMHYVTFMLVKFASLN